MARRPRRAAGSNSDFNAKHPRATAGRFGSKPGAPSSSRPTVGAKRLKSSGVTKTDRIVVLSSRVRKYKGFDTVESFVAAHPKGRAHALRLLAADHKKGLIGFEGAVTKPAASGATNRAVRAQDETLPQSVPQPGTPERRFHDGLLDAGGVFGPQAKVKVQYHSDGRPRAFSVDTGSESDIIQRTVNVYRTEGAVRTVDHDLFMLGDKNRPPGQAKQFLAKSVEAYRHIDIDRVNVHADINVGGYAWLKYGFVPDELSAPGLARDTLKKVEALKEAGAIDAATYAHLKRNLANHDFHAAVDIGGTRKVKFGGKNQSLGKHLFLGSDWTGRLDLRSAPAMSRFNAYVGKAE